VTENDAAVAQEMEIRTILKEELSRLMENAVAPEDIADGILLFDVGEEGSGNLVLDSLDAVELVMSIEQQWDMTAPDGVIDLPNELLGVIQQLGHSCA